MYKDKTSKKYQDIMKAGRHMFWKHGIKRVTVEDICQKANISRMTFYKFFNNKTDLAEKVLDRFYHDALKDFNQLITSDISFEEKMSGLVNFKLIMAKDMSMEIVNDIYNSDIPELREWFARSKEKSWVLFREFIEEGKKSGHIREGLKIEFLLYLVDQIIVMMNNKELTSLYGSTGELTEEVMHFFFYGILKRGNGQK